jgi:hypothetical protein
MPQSPLPAIPWSLLADGSALFFGQRTVSPEKNLDYFRLADLIQMEVGSSVAPKPGFFFTASQDSNEKQLKFNDMLQNELGWNVQACPPHEAMIANPLLTDQSCRVIRFDAMIAYCLGRLAGQPETKRIALITDSWPLARPVRDCVLRGTPVTVVFFGSVIDTRWHRMFREMDGKGLRFFDLDPLAERLFNRPRQPRRKEEEILPDLP